jgi:hypothetical protein
MNEWPKHDPITNRDICKNCWEGIHWHREIPKKDAHGNTRLYWVPCLRNDKGAVNSCDGECDCIHREVVNKSRIKKEKNPVFLEMQ